MSYDKIKVQDGKVLVNSESRPNVAYHVSRVHEVCPVDKEKKCQMKCDECGVCYHEYQCTCTDFLLKSNICKHIHLYKRYELEKEVCFSVKIKKNGKGHIVYYQASPSKK